MSIYATRNILFIFLVSDNLCVFFNEYFTWRQNLFFSLVKSYFQILSLIKFTNTLKMDSFLYGNTILRNINIMLHFVTFSLESNIMAWQMELSGFFYFFILICFLVFKIWAKTKLFFLSPSPFPLPQVQILGLLDAGNL